MVHLDGSATATDARMRGLLDAVVGVARELSLPETLRRIAEAACDLVGAEYGALGVLGAEGTLDEVFHAGMDEDVARRIARLPVGKGLIGKTLREHRSLRVADVAEHPEAVGFPDGHPRFATFLSVPIMMRGSVFGNLYLGGKRGAAAFTQQDEDLTAALASTVGFAIENARLYQETKRRQAWLAAIAEITTALLSVNDPEQALGLVARRVRQVASAAVAAILVPTEADALLVAAAEVAEDVTDLAAAEPEQARITGRILDVASALPGGGTWRLGQAVREGRAALISDDSRTIFGEGAPGIPVGAVMVVPLVAAGRSLGLLVVGTRPDATRCTRLDLEMAEAFASHAALTLELARVQRDRERLAVFEDRDRIARDLHDVVIQRLFATGLQLQGLSKLVEAPAGTRLSAAVGELDQTISDIRHTIFSLASPTGEGVELRPKILEIVHQAEHHLGLHPTVRIDGPVERGVPESIHSHLLAALREALSNITRHARATRIHVLIRVTTDEVLVEVRDNGRGPGGASRESGLANLRRRALDLGGTMEFGPGMDGTGTTVSWRVPLARPLPTLDVLSGAGRIPRP